MRTGRSPAQASATLPSVEVAQLIRCRRTGEFWKNLRPIENSLRPDALPEVCLSKVATDDDRYCVPFTETAEPLRTSEDPVPR